MEVIEKSSEMQERAFKLRQEGKRVAFVPTMGALHEGHLYLVDVAKQHGDVVVMSIFVNPTQFAPHEDFDQYPRDLNKDRSLAETRGVDILFIPKAEDIYPPGDQTYVIVSELTRGLCGPFRPGHFRGVTTVVARLFLITQPHVAVFGEKDYQQLVIIRRMVKDLHFPVDILGVPTVREKDGLAMSSRNSYLTREERLEALNLFKSITLTQELLKNGNREAHVLVENAHSQLSRGEHTDIEYVEVVDALDLNPVDLVEKPARLLMAVRVNGKRLIDNGELIP